MTNDTSSSAGLGAGLSISTTDPIRLFLKSACGDFMLSSNLRKAASELLSEPFVSYKAVRTIWVGSDPVTRPELIRVMNGVEFVFNSPKPREKSEELKARLKKLQELADRREYAELVKDITPKKATDEPFSSYKDQLGFGLHVVVTMFTGYLVGYAAFRALFSHNPVMNAAGGILGLVGAMLVETLLFIIRASNQEKRYSSPPSQMKKNQ